MRILRENSLISLLNVRSEANSCFLSQMKVRTAKVTAHGLSPKQRITNAIRDLAGNNGRDSPQHRLRPQEETRRNKWDVSAASMLDARVCKVLEENAEMCHRLEWGTCECVRHAARYARNIYRAERGRRARQGRTGKRRCGEEQRCRTSRETENVCATMRTTERQTRKSYARSPPMPVRRRHRPRRPKR